MRSSVILWQWRLAVGLVLASGCATRSLAPRGEQASTVLRHGTVDWPLPVHRDRLMLLLRETDAAGRQVDRERVLEDVRRLLARWRLVLVPGPTTFKAPPWKRCDNPWYVVVARADGGDFADREVAALAALRGHPLIDAAGPLIDAGMPALVGDTVDFVSKYGSLPLPAEALAYVASHGLTLSHSGIHLPATIGLHAISHANALAALAPEHVVVLRLPPVRRCSG